jgi:hypothetical protein
MFRGSFRKFPLYVVEKKTLKVPYEQRGLANLCGRHLFAFYPRTDLLVSMTAYMRMPSIIITMFRITVLPTLSLQCLVLIVETDLYLQVVQSSKPICTL